MRPLTHIQLCKQIVYAGGREKGTAETKGPWIPFKPENRRTLREKVVGIQIFAPGLFHLPISARAGAAAYSRLEPLL